MRHRSYICAVLALLAAVSGIGTGAAHAQPLANKDKWGLSDDSGIGTNKKPPEGSYAKGWGATAFERGTEGGFGWTRYWLYWNNANPSQGVYDWRMPDEEINAAIGKGQQIYANIMWAPIWAVQNTPGYWPWECMDASQSPPPYMYRPGCENRRPDTAAFQTFVREAVRRYGNKIRYWGFWNEPEYAIFWHSVYNNNDPENEANYRQNLKDLVDYILIPGAEAARAENPNVLIVGPDTGHTKALRYILEFEEEYRQRTGRRIFDVISFHQYLLDGDLVGFRANIDAFLTDGGLNTYRAGRPVWLSESAASTSSIHEVFELIEQRTWIDKFFYHGYKDGICLDPSMNPNECSYWWQLGQTPSAQSLIDRLDVRLPAFYKAKSFIVEARMFDEKTPELLDSALPGYEVATQFSASKNGTIRALRFYRAPGETGDNVLKLWTDTGTLLASARFVDNGTGASGWQQVALGAIPITAGTRYRVSVNVNTRYGKTGCGLGGGLTNGFLTAHSGYWGQPMGSMPINGSCSNFFVDVVFVRGHAIFNQQTPEIFDTAVPGYEVGTQFSSNRNGTIKGLRFWRAPGETGDNILRLWTDTGTLLASARFVDNGTGASGWQQVALGGIPITAGTRYRVSVNVNTRYVKTGCGLGGGLTNGSLTAHSGYWGQPRGSMPNSGSCSNFFVDLILE